MSESTKRKMGRLETQRMALELRMTGASYRNIAQVLGISVGSAHAHVTKALAIHKAQTQETAEQVRSLELERVDSIVMSLWSNRGTPRVTDSILRAMERRARLLGLDKEAPQVLNAIVNTPQQYDTSLLTTDEKRSLATLLARALAQPQATVPANGAHAQVVQVQAVPLLPGKAN